MCLELEDWGVVLTFVPEPTAVGGEDRDRKAKVAVREVLNSVTRVYGGAGIKIIE
jgi:hypothetical protein